MIFGLGGKHRHSKHGSGRGLTLLYAGVYIILIFTCLLCLGVNAEKKRLAFSNHMFVVYNAVVNPPGGITIQQMPYTFANTLVIFRADESSGNSCATSFVPPDPRTVGDYTFISVYNCSRNTYVDIVYNDSSALLPGYGSEYNMSLLVSPGETKTIMTNLHAYTRPNGLDPGGQLLYGNIKLYDRMWVYYGAC